MDYSVFIQVLGNFGFPIAVTMFLLLKLEKKLEEVEQAIHTLSKALIALRAREKK